MVFAAGDGTTPTEEQVEQGLPISSKKLIYLVRKIAKQLESLWGMCIPLSTNAFGTQKFLNMRLLCAHPGTFSCFK